MPLFASGAPGDADFLVLCLFGLGVALYFLPLAVALLRGHPNAAPILVVNLLLGWSLVGWVVALAWSFTAFEPARPRYRARSARDVNPFE